jgi:hypothetical protein
MNDSAKTAPTPADDFDNWREPLLASLRDCGTQPAPRYAVLRYGVAVLAVMFTMTVATILGRLLGAGLYNAPALIQLIGYFLFFVFVVAVLSRIRNYFLRQAWQSSARSAEDELKRLGSRRPILYLRSFGLDKRLGRPTWMERFLGTRPFATTEQQLTASLKQLGPVIAIGRPGEKLPPLGAARFYVSDDRWQAKIEDVERVAQLVVWATGVTEGLRWEIEHLVQHTRPKRLIVWAHPHLLGLSEQRREAEWARFRESIGKAFPQPLPEKLGSARFFIFDADWNPIPVPAIVTDVFSTRQGSALRAALLLQQNGSTEPERQQLHNLAADREPTDFGSLIGARRGPIYWPLVAVLAIVMTAVPLFNSFVDRLMIVMQGYEGARMPSLFWPLLSGVLTTAGLVAAFRFIRPSLLAALAAAAAITFVSFIVGFDWLPSEVETWGGFLGSKFVFPFLRDLLLFVCLVWTVRRWSRLAVALFGGALIAGIGAMLIREYQFTLMLMGEESSWRGLLEAIGMTCEKLTTDLRYFVTPAFRALVFAGLYVSLLKLLPLVGFDERRPTPRPAAQTLA